ncbi:response regulator [Halobacteriovorax sp. GB3]|uniref:response regulator n=1 Tax=Halobacteriovorax sp. GB3 TaxID=2719615 RepID=UPI00235DE631|nr:response regulator [Halobacteriovorax sp. GB3]MDD0853191.1 response regulator [Halobacteriovorax sp. GB3]
MTKKVLIVDDEKDVHFLFECKLGRDSDLSENEYIFAENGQEAFEIYKERGDIDMIITDLDMPVMNGLDFISLIREEDEHTPIFVISMHSDMDRLKRAHALKVRKYLIKPFDFDELFEEMKALMSFTPVADAQL